LTNKDSYNTQIIQCVNDTIFRKRFRVPGFGTGSGTLEPVPWNRFLRQITKRYVKTANILVPYKVGRYFLDVGYGFRDWRIQIRYTRIFQGANDTAMATTFRQKNKIAIIKS